MIRRPSRTESSSSSSEITFDDVDDHQVFALLEEGDEERQPASAKPSKGYVRVVTRVHFGREPVRQLTHVCMRAGWTFAWTFHRASTPRLCRCRLLKRCGTSMDVFGGMEKAAIYIHSLQVARSSRARSPSVSVKYEPVSDSSMFA